MDEPGVDLPCFDVPDVDDGYTCCGRPVCHGFPNLQSTPQASQAEREG